MMAYPKNATDTYRQLYIYIEQRVKVGKSQEVSLGKAQKLLFNWKISWTQALNRRKWSESVFGFVHRGVKAFYVS